MHLISGLLTSFTALYIRKYGRIVLCPHSQLQHENRKRVKRQKKRVLTWLRESAPLWRQTVDKLLKHQSRWYLVPALLRALSSTLIIVFQYCSNLSAVPLWIYHWSNYPWQMLLVSHWPWKRCTLICACESLRSTFICVERHLQMQSCHLCRAETVNTLCSQKWNTPTSAWRLDCESANFSDQDVITSSPTSGLWPLPPSVSTATMNMLHLCTLIVFKALDALPWPKSHTSIHNSTYVGSHSYVSTELNWQIQLVWISVDQQTDPLLHLWSRCDRQAKLNLSWWISIHHLQHPFAHFVHVLDRDCDFWLDCLGLMNKYIT